MHISARCAIPVLLLCTGCSWYPYNPYYYGNGGAYPNNVPPGGYVAPGPTYIPQNGPILNAPTSPSSPTLIPANPPNNSPKPNWNTSPNNSNDAPTFNPNPPNNPVPLPRDDPFNTSQGAAAMVRPPGASTASAFPSISARVVQPVGLQSDDPFLEPARLSGNADAQPMPTENSSYGYDSRGYTWLKGMVSFDKESESWDIIYALRPDPSDQFGGSLVLDPPAQVRNLHPGDLVKLEGQPNASARDSQGRPVYHVTKVTLVGRRSER